MTFVFNPQVTRLYNLFYFILFKQCWDESEAHGNLLLLLIHMGFLITFCLLFMSNIVSKTQSYCKWPTWEVFILISILFTMMCFQTSGTHLFKQLSDLSITQQLSNAYSNADTGLGIELFLTSNLKIRNNGNILTATAFWFPHTAGQRKYLDQS